MANSFTGMAPTTLAEYYSLLPDSKEGLSRKVFIQTIRDYQAFFDRARIQRGNDGMGNKGEIITTYPKGQKVGLNEGYETEVALGRSFRAPSSMVRTRSVVGVELLQKMNQSDAAEYRLRRDKAFIRGLTRSMVHDVLWGDPSTNDKECMGLMTMTNGSMKEFENRILDAGSKKTTGNTSVLLVNWQEDESHLFYPENGSEFGIFTKAHNEPVLVPDKNGKMMWAMVTDVGYDLGVFVARPENIVRIANIDPESLTKQGKTGANLLDLFKEARHMLQTDSFSNCAFYCNDAIGLAADFQMEEKGKYQLTYQSVGGRDGILTYGGIPIYQYGTDIIGNDEGLIGRDA